MFQRDRFRVLRAAGEETSWGFSTTSRRASSASSTARSPRPSGAACSPSRSTAALRRELDTKAAVVSRDRILVPNRFAVRLAPGDHERMTNLGPALIDEFTQLVQQHAAAQHYSFAGGISITLERDDRASATGIVRIDSVNVKGEVAWTPVLDIGGKRYPIVEGAHDHRPRLATPTSRSTTPAPPASTSRSSGTASAARCNDLGSTNGSKLNGQPLKQAPLPPDSVIEIGRTRIVFRVLAQAADVDQFADLRMATTRSTRTGGRLMSELTLLLLRLGFLVLLWVFVFAIVYALRADLFGQRARRLPAQAAGLPRRGAAHRRSGRPRSPRPVTEPTAHRAPPHAGAKTAKRLVITSRPPRGRRDRPARPSSSRSAARANRGSSSATTTPRPTTRA